MIQVGINENVIVTNASINDKGTLVLAFDEVGNLEKSTVDVFEAMQTAAVENTGKTEFTLNIFPFKKPSGPKNESKTEVEILNMISDDIMKVKNQLTQLLEQYLTSDNIKWEPYRGTGIDKTNYQTSLLVEEKLALIFENYAKDFIKMITPFLKKPEFKIRIKLVRQSKEKHYATIPGGKFLKDSPWVELMDIPADRSKVKFSKWEIDNGYNDGTPIPRAAADVPDAPPATAEASSPFGQR